MFRLTVWLAAAIAAVRDWLAPPAARVDYEPIYRRYEPIGPPEIRVEYPPKVHAAKAHCINCYHRGTVKVPEGDAGPRENEILDRLECPVCGLYTMCSD